MRSIRTFLTITAITSCLAALPASGNGVFFNDRLPFSLDAPNECTGELVSVSGIFHVVVRREIQNDGTVVDRVHINAHGEGEGLETGSLYVWNDTNRALEMTTPNGDFSLTQFFRTRLVSRGAMPDLHALITETFEIIGGVPSMEISFEITCLGSY